MKYYNDGAFFDEHDDSRMNRWYIKLNIKAATPEQFTVALRVPAWIQGSPVLSINNEDPKELMVQNGYLELDRVWSDDTINQPESFEFVPIYDIADDNGRSPKCSSPALKKIYCPAPTLCAALFAWINKVPSVTKIRT